ncbi:MAG TPA: tRNA pseudouridine(13) synthase TruD [Steroidobacteraceae bacterium]|nr:tRNA pseudouridine(13) synthase TruD [Steroidobacteraceae bacterium]
MLSAQEAGPVLSALEAALSPPRAYGAPVAHGLLRVEPEDFLVEEELGFAPAGHGAHLLLKVRKRNANTQWVASELARLARCRPAEVGYAGLKDRHAVAVQWYSLPQPRAPLDWQQLRTDDFEVLEAHPHTRKLPRGALAGNRFAVRIRAPDGDGAALAARLAVRLAMIARRGVPNYFGPQRFGRSGSNLRAAGATPERLPRQQRGFALSAARSVLFNALLAARVSDGSWERLEPGDLANIDGRGSVFRVGTVDAALSERCARLEIHPTGPLWGAGAPGTAGAVLELESAIAARYPDAAAACSAAHMAQERRSLRLAVRELRCDAEPQAVRVEFRLARGGFATAVLAELIESHSQESST